MSDLNWFDLSMNDQRVRASTITRVRQQLEGDIANNLSFTQVKALHKRIENAYTEFETVHQKLVSASNRVDSATSLPYFSENTIDVVTATYFEADDLLLRLLSKFSDSHDASVVEITDHNASHTRGETSPSNKTPTNPVPPHHSTAFPQQLVQNASFTGGDTSLPNASNNNATQQSTTTTSAQTHVNFAQLPNTTQSPQVTSQMNFSQINPLLFYQSLAAGQMEKVDFPKFNGDYTKWRSFSQLFSHIYGKNQFLTDAMKLAHLRQKLEGE